MSTVFLTIEVVTIQPYPKGRLDSRGSDAMLGAYDNMGCSKPPVRAAILDVGGLKSEVGKDESSAAAQNRTCCKAKMAVRDVIRERAESTDMVGPPL